MKRKADEADEAKRIEKKKMKKHKNSAKRAEKGPTEKGDNLEHIDSQPSSPKKKKKKMLKEKGNKDKKKKQKSASESSQDDDSSTSQTVESDKAPKKSGHSQSKSLADWTVEDYETLLHSLENLTEGGGVVYNKIPSDLWGNVSVGDHSLEACQTAWAKICQVVRNRMTLEQMLHVIKDMLGSPKYQQIASILVGKKNLFPGAPQNHLVNSYQLYTQRRLTEIPKPSFKDVGLGWKSLSEDEKKNYQKEAEKINKKVKREIEEYLASLSPEMKERYINHHKQAKSLAGKMNTVHFPGAPHTHLVNSYQLYTSKRLAETPQPSFKDIGLGWKSLSEDEKKDYQEEAEKMNKKIKREKEDYLATLSPEMKEKYLEYQKQPKNSHAQKLKKEFADAPKTTHTNSYNAYTRERLAEKPTPSFKEIASCWKSMSEVERKPYQTKAAQINAETKKTLEKYVQSLSEDERKRFLKKKEKEPKKPPLRKKPVLGQRDLKKAEVQYLMEEKDSAIKENPEVEEEEVLQRLSEAFRALDYEEQKSYLQRAKESASEQKKITEFYKNFESPVMKSKQRQTGKVKSSQKSKKDSGHSSDSSSDSSSDEEVMKKSVMKPPVKALVSKSSASPAKKVIANAKSSKKDEDSDSSSDDSSDEEVTKKSVMKPPVKALVSKSLASPAKTNSKSSKKDYDSDSSSVSSSDSSSDDEITKKSVIKPPVKALTSKTNSSSPTKKHNVNSKSPVKSTPQKKTPAKPVKEDSSSSDSSDDDEEKAKGKVSPVVPMSPTKKTLPSPAKPVKKKSSSSDSSSSDEGEATMIPVSPQKKSISTPTKPVRRKSSSSDSSSDDDEEEAEKGSMSPVIPATPSSAKKAVKRPHPKSSSSSSASSSDDSDDDFTSSQKRPPPPKIVHSQKKSISTPSSLKAHKKKQK